MEEGNVHISDSFKSVELSSPPDVNYLQKQLDIGWQLVTICQYEWPQGHIVYTVYFRQVF
jgi:hypothetical protein